MPRATPSIVFATLATVLVLSGLDQTVLSAALPAIVRELQGADRASWVFSAFLIASTAVVPIYGKLADRWGARVLLLVATAIFTLGSIACGVASSMEGLIAARALQGLGGGGLMTLTMLSVAMLYAPVERGPRMSMLGAAYGLAVMIGPLLGALIAQHGSWRWAFLANVPLAAAAWAVLRTADFGQPLHVPRHRIDLAGATLLAATLVGTLLATRSHDLAGAAPLLVGAAVLLLAWLWVERRAEDPIVPLSLFACRGFTPVAVLSAASGVALFAAVVFLPLYLQAALYLTPTASALHLLPLMGGITVGGRIAGRRLRARASARALALAGVVAAPLAYSALAVTLVQAATSAMLVSACALPLGLGLGLLFPVLTVVAQRSAPPRQMGIATAMPVMLRALGGAIGVALLGELLYRRGGADGMAHALAGLFGAVALVLALAGCAAWRVPRALPPAADPRAAPDAAHRAPSERGAAARAAA